MPVESRMRGDAHVRFGGRERETEPVKSGHRALSRPYISRTMPATRTCSLKSSPGDTRSDPPSSQPTSPSPNGARSSPTPPASSPSLTDSSIDPRSSPSTPSPTGSRNPRKPREVGRKSEPVGVGPPTTRHRETFPLPRTRHQRLSTSARHPKKGATTRLGRRQQLLQTAASTRYRRARHSARNTQKTLQRTGPRAVDL